MSLTAAKEGNTYLIDYAFTNENGSAVSVLSGAWSLRDNFGNIVNGRSAVSIIAPASSGTVVLTKDDLIYEKNSSTFRTFTLSAVYSGDFGSACTIAEEASFEITPLIGV